PGSAVGVETRCLADDTVDVLDHAAAAAHHVVVVVADARLVESGGAGRLDAAGQSGAGEGAEDVVDGLSGDRGEPTTHLFGDLLDIHVATLAEYVEHGEPGLGHPQPGHPQRLRI